MHPQLSASRRVRSGRAAIFLLFGMTVILMLVLLPINAQLMLEAQTAQQNAGDAAALASVHVLVDDRALINNPRILLNLVEKAKTEAVRIAGLNYVAGKPLVLQKDEHNDPKNDIAFGVLTKPENKNVFAGSWSDSSFLTSINTVRITARKTRKRHNEIHLIGGRLFCLTAVDLVTISTATLDCFVVGFRNNGRIPIPMAPFAVKCRGEDGWEFAVEGDQGPDEFEFDATTRRFKRGSDGLREIKVCFAAPDGIPTNGRLLKIGTENPTELAQQIVGGIRKEHLRKFGRDLVFAPKVNELTVPRASIRNNSGFSAMRLLREELEKLQSSGEARIWPLYCANGDGDDDDAGADNDKIGDGQSLVISRFVAARVIAVQTTDERLCVWLQPAKMATATAVTNSSRRCFADGSFNRYICRIRLVE